MNRGEIVIYWHNSGVVIYKINGTVVANLGQADLSQVSELLSKYSGFSARVLLSDNLALSDPHQHITNICHKLNINIITIETESIAKSRHQNPVIGISQPQSVYKFKPSYLFLLISIISLISTFVIWQNKSSSISAPIPTPTLIPIPTSVPSPSPVSIKKINELQVEVLNGTSKSGFAKTVGDRLILAGFTNITTGNAPSNDYPQSKLVFVSEELKGSYLNLITDVYSVESDNISVDKSITKDIQLILGLN